MEEDHLAEWLSVYPNLIEIIRNRPNIEKYLRGKPVTEKDKRVSDDQWKELMLLLEP